MEPPEEEPLPICSDCLRPSTPNWQRWQKDTVKLCGAETRMTDAKLQCAEMKIERLEDELSDWNLIKNEPVVIGCLSAAKMWQRHAAAKGSP